MVDNYLFNNNIIQYNITTLLPVYIKTKHQIWWHRARETKKEEAYKLRCAHLWPSVTEATDKLTECN